MEEKYIPTLPQKLFRVILGTVLVPLFGDMCILIWLFSTVDNAIPEKDFHGLLIISYIFATIFTAIPTFIMRLLLEFTT
ncbi:MAG: hypothetical protein IJR44_01305, partial [Neisseriaceae bacterium]|nr:hypothetical protein [Neisseriaceae bacterium]